MYREEFKNIEKFKKWFLEKIWGIYADEYSDDVYLNAITNQYYLTGNCEYKMSKFISKSGNTEIYQYDVKIVRDELKGITEIIFIL